MAKLAGTVHVIDSDNQAHVFGPGDAVPGWAVPLITNPKAWEDGEQPTPTASEDEAPAAPAGPTPPPRKGKGSSIEAWRAYAAEVGYESDDDATRDEIIATLEADGVPVE